jgi:HEPN domain-containing protein
MENRKIKDEDIMVMLQYILQNFKNSSIDDETKKLADDLLFIANEDLKVCELLHDSNKYPYAIEKLQQSVEKASKAYVLYHGNFSKKEIRKIRHNSVDAFVMLLDKMGEYITIVKKMYPDMKTDTNDLKNLIKDDKKRLELSKADYKSYEVIFTMFDNIRKSFYEQLDDIFPLIEDFSLQGLLKEGLKDSKYDVSDYINGKDNKEIINQFTDLNWIKSFIMHNLDFIMLYTIAGFTFPHFKFTRYPDEDMEPSDYTPDLGIVKATPELVTHLKRIYASIDDCLKNIN